MDETTVYKITRTDLTTHNGYQWVIGETREFPGTGDLCGPGYAYAYESAQLALLLKSIHVDYDPYYLLRGRGVIVKRDGQLKAGCSRLTLLERIPVPDITLEQRVTFAVLCARAVYAEPRWTAWAEGWLAGTDRSAKSAAAQVPASTAGAAEATAKAAAVAALAAVTAKEKAAETGVTVWVQASEAESAAWAALTAKRAALASDTERLDLAAIARKALLPWEPK